MQSKQFERASEQLQQQQQIEAVRSIAALPITSTEACDLLPGLANNAFDAAGLPVSLQSTGHALWNASHIPEEHS